MPSKQPKEEEEWAKRLYTLHILPKRPSAQIKKAHWRRFEENMHITIDWSDAIQTHSYQYGLTPVVGNLDANGKMIYSLQRRPRTRYDNIDVLELWWVREKNFKEEVIFNKQKAYYFNDGLGRQAWFSKEKRLPIASQNGNIQISYEFGSIPQPIQFPDEVTQLLKESGVIKTSEAQIQR